MRAILLALAVGAIPDTAPAADAQAVPVLVYHQIVDPGHEPLNEITITLEDFEQQMAHLAARGWRTISTAELVAFVGGAPVPERSVVIHFDDGWKSALRAIPVLERHGFKAAFWIIAGTGIGWAHMEWADVEAIAANPLFEVYSHTMTHPWRDASNLKVWLAGGVAGKGAADVEWELGESKRVLERRLARPVPYLAWPRGLYNDRLVEMAVGAGYAALFTTDKGLNVPGGDVLRVRRAMINGACGMEVFEAILRDGFYRNCSATPPR